MIKYAILFFALLIFCIAISLFNPGCSKTDSGEHIVSEEPKEESGAIDRVSPRLKIEVDELSVSICSGEEYDLMTGITGTDNIDGNITEKIKLDIGDYDPKVPGVYMITYTLTDSAGNEANPIKRTVIVRDTEIFTAPPVYTEAIEGEVKNPEAPGLFGGAWYHKVVSSKDKWLGIEGTVTLPEVKIRRYDGDYNTELDVDPNAKNLDNPSVYMGGNATNESDVGLSFSRALVDVDLQTLSKGCIAFRPFWRYITDVNQDVGGYDKHNGEYAVSATNNNCIANYHWRYTEYYYLPGDKLRMIIYIPEPNKMQLQIEVIEKSTLQSSVSIRERYGWKDPADFKSPIFHSPGHGTGINAEYKRVNAIDQVANEGKTAINSGTEIKNAVWQDTYLYRKIGDLLYRLPMDNNRRGVLSAPDSKFYTVTFDGVDRSLGGEVITIHPGYQN